MQAQVCLILGIDRVIGGDFGRVCKAQDDLCTLLPFQQDAIIRICVIRARARVHQVSPMSVTVKRPCLSATLCACALIVLHATTGDLLTNVERIACPGYHWVQ